MSTPENLSDFRTAWLMRLAGLRRHLAVAQAAWIQERQRPQKALRSSEEMAFLPAVVEIVERPASPAGRGTALAVSAMFACSLAWACLGRLDIHATAQGRIIPAGKTKPVAASELAMVAAIFVKDGDRVQQGQVLVDLDPAAPQSDLLRLRREMQEQMVIALRQRALLDGETTITPPAGADISAALLEVHERQLRQRLADHRATIDGLENERRQKQAERSGNLADIERLRETVPLLAEQSRTKGEMAEMGWQSRTEFLRVEQEHIDRQQELETARHRLAQTDAAIASASEKLRQAEAQFRAEALVQLADAEQKAASLAHDVVKADDRREGYHLLAPVTGVVQQLGVHAVGAVVQPAQAVLMIVPEDEGIAIEATLPNKDAGFVTPGQSAEIKVEALPFTRYGTVNGTVEVISADSVQDAGVRPAGDPNGNRQPSQAAPELQGPNYSVRVRPHADHLRAGDRVVALTPGMSVTVEIKTGRRRVIQYVLDPIVRYEKESLRER